MLQSYQRDFIELCLNRQALKFGDFTLKSGRKSPYFYNAGVFHTGNDIRKLGELYATAIHQAKLDYDLLFGPAYKGIPLVVATAIGLTHYGIDNHYAFNRKETKAHGEGGEVVGANLRGKKVLLIDDVISAGTAVRESMRILTEEQATLAGVVVSLDRQERGQGTVSAIQEVQDQYGAPVIRIATITDLMHYLREQGEHEKLARMEQYHKEYGA